MCSLLTGKDSSTAIFQMDGGTGYGSAGPLVEAGKGRTDPGPLGCPFHQCLLLSAVLSKQLSSFSIRDNYLFICIC